ncbi:hypothetical protein [Burkholderia ubonensis]|uniref:Restriction alleviation protein, Lar family n=1 Tax=Burkholderia ubonensis TaxID=101571 RepID=A0ABD4EAX8_9BURK|nr:hypothetical protein [Burkholderia ubonensis]KVN92567.1 hypothetical protein WJ68_33645 [Burkholderia ubonensis]
MSEQLRPCPCGGKVKITEKRRGNYRREGSYFQGLCGRCHARGPLIQDSPEKATQAWNQHVGGMCAAPTAAAPTTVQIARAIWAIRRVDEDRCDMELEDMGMDHSVWREAQAVRALLAGRSATPKESK